MVTNRTYLWSTWLKDALESDPFVKDRLIYTKGWETRGRPSNLFSYFPSGIVEHHTACWCKVGHDAQTCANIIISGHGGTPGPISQLLGTLVKPGERFTGSNWSPRIMVLAAGRSNHAGSGSYPWGAPTGNGSSIGIEWCGPVSYWPDEAIELRHRVSAAMLKFNNWGEHQVCSHHEYAPNRKSDPSGAYRDEPSLALNTPWNMDVYRNNLRVLIRPPVNDSVATPKMIVNPTKPLDEPAIDSEVEQSTDQTVITDPIVDTGDNKMKILTYRTPAEIGTPAFTGFSLNGNILGHQVNSHTVNVDRIGGAEEIDINLHAFGNRISAEEVMSALIQSYGTVTAAPPCVRENPSWLEAWRRNALNEAAKS